MTAPPPEQHFPGSDELTDFELMVIFWTKIGEMLNKAHSDYRAKNITFRSKSIDVGGFVINKPSIDSIKSSPDYEKYKTELNNLNI